MEVTTECYIERNIDNRYILYFNPDSANRIELPYSLFGKHKVIDNPCKVRITIDV